jgi:hypothetical protein
MDERMVPGEDRPVPVELTYDEVLTFMEEYFPVYSEYGQDPATSQRMHEYYAADFVFTGRVGYPEPVVYPSAEAFVKFDVSHPSSYERLTPEDLAIDVKRGIAYATLKFEFIERATGRVLAVERGVSRYQLALDTQGAIKITSIDFFPERLPPGSLSGAEIFARDWKERGEG